MKIIDCREKIYSLVIAIPEGKVSTYGAISTCLNLPSPRIVGRVLHSNPSPDIIPCHRVVNSAGHLSKSYAFGGLAAQKQKLEAEGMKIINKKVDLKKYFWKPISADPETSSG